MENRKRGRETSDHHHRKKKTNNRKKRQVMTAMDDDDDVEISYKLENMKNFTQTEEYHDDEAGAGIGAGVFDFPWLKGSEDVNFRAEIDECLDSTFPASTSSYDYDDRGILSVVPTSSCCSDIVTTTTTTISNSCDNTLFDQKRLRLEQDLDLDLDLIDQFFLDNPSNTGTAQSSHDDQLKMNKVEDKKLKIELNDDKSTC